LNGLQVVDGISNDQVRSLFIWSFLVLETFLKLHCNPVSKDNKWNTSKGYQRFLPAEDESNDKSTKESEESFSGWSQCLGSSTVQDSGIRRHNTCKHT